MDVGGETGEGALLQLSCKRGGDVFEGAEEHCGSGSADSAQEASALVDEDVVREGAWSCVVSVLGDVDVQAGVSAVGGRQAVATDSRRGSGAAVVGRAAFDTFAFAGGIGYVLEGVVEVEVRVVFGGSSRLAADVGHGHSAVDLVGVAVEVGVDGAVDHAADVEEEQQAAEHVPALAVVLVQGPALHVLEIRCLFLLLFSSHCYFSLFL